MRVVQLGTGRFAVECESHQGRVLINGSKATQYGRHGALGAIDGVGEMLKRFILGEMRKGDVEQEGKEKA